MLRCEWKILGLRSTSAVLTEPSKIQVQVMVVACPATKYIINSVAIILASLRICAAFLRL